MKFKISKKDALIIVDVQVDFCTGGALPVFEGDQVVPVLNDYMTLFGTVDAQIFATRDWHPPNHASFKAYGGVWPAHCIHDGEGAKFHPDLMLPEGAKIISKATTPSKEAYSGFDETDLEEELKERGVTRVFIGGLATDYCVKNTVLDALRLGFETVLLIDAIRGVNVQSDDSKDAIKEMKEKGAKTATFSDIEVKTTLDLEEEFLMRFEDKKRARYRTRGPYRKSWRSR